MNNQFNDDELQKAIDNMVQNGDIAQATVPVVGPDPATLQASATDVSESQVLGGTMTQSPSGVVMDTQVENKVTSVPQPEAQPVGEQPIIRSGAVDFDASTTIKQPETLETPSLETVGSTNEVDSNQELGDVKNKILRDLAPILKNMSVNPDQKFKIYCDMVEDLGDKGVVTDAYEVVGQMTDENAKGEALLKLIEIIDK